MGVTYGDFLDLDYEPTDEDLVCTFRIDPMAGMSMEAAASRIASESFSGMQTALQTGTDFADVGTMTFDIDDDLTQVAYPIGLLEPGNMSQMPPCIAGNIIGMKAINTIRLLDYKWPESAVSTYPGPLCGSSVRKEILGITDRSVTATIPKLKVDLSTVVYAQVGYDTQVGGVNLLRDDENLTGQALNPFSDHPTESLSLRDDAEDEMGEKKSCLINVTADTRMMLDRVDEVIA